MRAAKWLVLPLLGGCNRYELFDLAGYEQASFNNQADVLFVIDNSPSMAEETAALALNFNVFIDTLTSREYGAGGQGLGDAVDDYVTYTQERGRFIDYHLAITTTSADYSKGATTNAIDPGEAGTFVGDVLAKGDAGLADAFRRQLLCEAANWNQYDVPSDPSYECGDDPGDQVSQEYLDCVCGFGEWEDNASGSGDEEPLEAMLTALCRSVPEPPEACFEAQGVFGDTVPDKGGGGGYEFVPYDGPDPEQSRSGFLRDGSTVVVVVVSDEGDSSRRLAQGEVDPTVYLDALDEFEGHRVRIAEIGPDWDGDTVLCPSTSIPTWSVERMVTATSETGGFYAGITDGRDETCQLADFADRLVQLGQLLNNLLRSFPLRSVPDVSTILVYIDREEVPPATLVEGEPGQPGAVYDDGWSYDSSDNAVVFWGDWVPDYNSDVRIYYRPLSGNPRELPF